MRSLHSLQRVPGHIRLAVLGPDPPRSQINQKKFPRQGASTPHNTFRFFFFFVFFFFFFFFWSRFARLASRRAVELGPDRGVADASERIDDPAFR